MIQLSAKRDLSLLGFLGKGMRQRRGFFEINQGCFKMQKDLLNKKKFTVNYFFFCLFEGTESIGELIDVSFEGGI